MALLKEKDRNVTSNNELCKFGLLMTVCFALLGGLLLWKDNHYYWCSFIISIVFLFFSIILPYALIYIYKPWMKFSQILGFFMSKLILGIIFYLILLPISIIMRLVGKKTLHIDFRKDSSNSYWIPKKTDDSSVRDYERQF
jgi:hypothetical protein